MSRRIFEAGLLLAALAALGAGCSSGDAQLTKGCSADEDCGDPASWRCDLDTGECLCRTSAACPEGQICNSQGYCQEKVGCYESSDCPTGYFCDTTTNTCLALGRCSTDLHCEPGELCDAATRICKPGCRSYGDCKLGEACLCSTIAEDGTETPAPCDCQGTSEEERAGCQIGRCSTEACVGDGFCGYGEVCRASDDGALPTCQSDYDPVLRPYCDNCVYGPGSEECGQGPNFCLYSTYTHSTYCGVDCSDGQACANGFDCADVIVVWTRTKCTSDALCAGPALRSSIPCSTNEDCPNHGICDLASGFCYGRCDFHEGANESFCSCVEDDDCAQDSCNPVTRVCSISKRPCDLEGNGCRQIRCVDFGEQGGCLIGQNCKPLEGLTCADVRP